MQGRILKKEAKERYTLGVVYEPDTVDSQGEFAKAADIEKACWEFNKLIQNKTVTMKRAMQMYETVVKAIKDGKDISLDVTDIAQEIEKGDGLGLMHEAWDPGFGDIVENYITRAELEIETPDGIQKVKKGSWMQGIIWSEGCFAKVESGELTGLSMGGRAQKIQVKEVS